MKYLFDILASFTLLFFFLTGWHRGFVVSTLRIASVVTSYVGAVFTAKNLGGVIAETIGWPRIIAIPMIGIFTYVTITLIFSLIIHQVVKRHRKREEEDEFHLSITNCFWGGTVSLIAGIAVLIVAFWMYDTFKAGVFGRSFPDADDSRFGTISRKVVYQTAYAAIPKNEDSREQAEKLARLISEPSLTTKKVEAVLNEASIQQMATDKQFGKDFLSGDAERIRQNETLQALFRDHKTLDQLQELGVISGYDTHDRIAEKLAKAGTRMQAKLSDPKIQGYVAQLQHDNMLTPEKIPMLLRDRRFLLILDGLMAE